MCNRVKFSMHDKNETYVVAVFGNEPLMAHVIQLHLRLRLSCNWVTSAPSGLLSHIKTWFAEHCFSRVKCTYCIVQYNTARVFIYHYKSLHIYIRGNYIYHILLKWFHLITLHINTVMVWPCAWRNIVMFERRSVYLKSIAGLSLCFHSKVHCVAMVFICGVMELTGMVTSLQTLTMADASASYRLGVDIMHGISV